MFEAELQSAIDASRSAGAEVARLRQNGVRYGHKAGRELVSEADLRAAEMLHEALTAAFPDTGWLSEEHVDTSERLRRERVWIVDPIDGTREFLQGLPEYAISVALVVQGAPVLGVVYNPATSEMHAAACYEATERAPTARLEQFAVLVGRGEHSHDRIPPLPPGSRTRPIGSVAYRMALVASGTGDAALTGYGRAEWDVAAGTALCLAAGLRVTDALGSPLQFNQPDPYVRGLLTAEPGLHRRIRTYWDLMT